MNYITTPTNINEPKRFFLFQNRRLLIVNTESGISIPLVRDIADLPVQLMICLPLPEGHSILMIGTPPTVSAAGVALI
jgi:hypothetical protein